MSSQNIGFMTPEVWAAVLQLGQAEPPPGVTPNFEHPEFHGQPVIIISAISLSLLIGVMAVRLYAKICITKQFTLDDYVYFVSWPAGVAFICLSVAMISGGAYGYHAWDVRIGQLTKAIIIRSQIQQSIAGPICWLIRLSLFALILFSFSPLRWTKILVYGGAAVSGIIYFIPLIAYSVICRPRGGTDQVAYIAGMASVECANTSGLGSKMSIMIGVLNVVTDFYILILPLPAIRNLQVSKKTRIGIYIVFLTAIVGCMTSIVVLVFRIRLVGNQDVTYAVIPVFASAVAETTVGLMIPCAASFATVWRHFQSKKTGSTIGNSWRNVMGNVTAWTGRSKSTVNLAEKDKGGIMVKRSWEMSSTEMVTPATADSRDMV